MVFRTIAKNHITLLSVAVAILSVTGTMLSGCCKSQADGHRTARIKSECIQLAELIDLGIKEGWIDREDLRDTSGERAVRLLVGAKVIPTKWPKHQSASDLRVTVSSEEVIVNNVSERIVIVLVRCKSCSAAR